MEKKNVKKMLDKKGQTTMLELLMGTMLVLVVLIAIMNSFQVTLSSIQTQNRFLDLSQQSGDALQALLYNPGSTTDRNTLWEKQAALTDVNRIGLAKSPLLLSEAKVRKFREWADGLDYNALSQKMGLGNYDFSVTLFVNDPICQEQRVIVQDSLNYGSCGLTGNGSWYDQMGMDTPGNISVLSLALDRSAALDTGFFCGCGGKSYYISNDPVMVRLKVYARP